MVLLVEAILAPRMMLLGAHLFLVTAALLDREPHVLSGLPRDDGTDAWDIQKDSADGEFRNRLVLAIILLVIEWIGLLSGVSLLDITVGMWNCFFNGLGCVLCNLFLVRQTHYGSFVYIFWMTNVVPVFLEAFAAIKVFVLKRLL
jgi:hypothetical protein